MVKRYDAGLLSDYGGGNVEWWQDYLRAEIERCNDHWEAEYDDLEAKVRRLEEDKSRLDWLQEIMRSDSAYCEIYLSGLRNFTGEALGYQVESNPEMFKVQNGQSLRDAIDKARKALEEGSDG